MKNKMKNEQKSVMIINTNALFSNNMDAKRLMAVW